MAVEQIRDPTGKVHTLQSVVTELRAGVTPITIFNRLSKGPGQALPIKFQRILDSAHAQLSDTRVPLQTRIDNLTFDKSLLATSGQRIQAPPSTTGTATVPDVQDDVPGPVENQALRQVKAIPGVQTDKGFIVSTALESGRATPELLRQAGFKDKDIRVGQIELKGILDRRLAPVTQRADPAEAILQRLAQVPGVKVSENGFRLDLAMEAGFTDEELRTARFSRQDVLDAGEIVAEREWSAGQRVVRGEAVADTTQISFDEQFALEQQDIPQRFDVAEAGLEGDFFVARPAQPVAPGDGRITLAPGAFDEVLLEYQEAIAVVEAATGRVEQALRENAPLEFQKFERDRSKGFSLFEALLAKRAPLI